MPNYIPEFQGYSGQGAFRYWCQKVLPLVYDDSLSYYELLNKIVVYLNNTIEDVSKAEGNIDSLLTAYTQLQNYVNDYFDNLDVQEQINNKLDEMAENGELSDLLEPFIPDLVTAWLNEHITPTSPIVDNTLSITGAAADAKVTGDEIAKAIKSLTYISHDDLNGYTTANDFPNNSVICIGSNVIETDIANLPSYGELSYVITTSYASNAASKCQLYMGVSRFAFRVRTSGTWGSWKITANNASALKYELQTLSNYNSLAELPVNIVTLANNTQGFTDFPPNTTSGVVFNMQYSQNYMVQFFICFQTNKIRVWWRVINIDDNSAYTPWIGLANLEEINSLAENKADKTEILRYSAYDLSSYPTMASTPINEIRSFSRDNVSWTDIPEGVVSGSLYNLRVSPSQKMQFLYTYQGTYNIWYRIVGMNEPFTPLTEWHKVLAPEDLGTLENNSMKYISSLSAYINENNFDSLSDVKENIVAVYNSSSDFNMPDSAFSNFIFMNMRYAPNFNIQFAFTAGGKQFKYRIVDRRNGNIYTHWNAPDSFDGKVCLALGDSICYGARNGRKGFIGYFNLSVINESRVAARLSNTRINEDTGEYKSYCIYKQLIDFATDTETSTYVPDIIISDGGVNDYAYANNSVQLGTFNGIPKTTDAECESLDLSTIAGGTEYLFYNMIKYYPSAQRFFVLTHRTKTFPYTQNSNGYTQTDAFNLIKDIAKSYGVYVIDIFNESMINTAFSQYVSPIPFDYNNPSATADYYVDDDGTHPLDRGYREGYVPLVRKALTITTLKPQITNFSGDVVRLWQFSGNEKLKSVVAQITDGGRTHVDLMVTKKNMLLRPYIHDDTFENRGITFTVQENGTIKASGTLLGSDQPFNAIKRIWLQPGVMYSISHGCDHPRAFCVAYFRNYTNTATITPDGWDVDNNQAISSTYISTLYSGFHAKRTFYVNEPCAIEFQLRFSPTSEAQTITDAIFKPMLYIGGENDNWDIAPTYKTAQGQLISIPLGTTVDEGELNVTTGELTVTQPSEGTYQLTPIEVTTLNGFNQIISDTGAVSVVRNA